MKPISQALILGFLSICCVGYSQTPVKTVPPPAPTIRIALVGDSTQTKNAGYGLGFCANLTGSVTCINDAKGGASTKTYYQEGYWTKALADKPDYMLIQFGHNDEESKDHLARETNLQTEYPVNLKRYVEEARAHGIIPILVTPLTRRYYEVDGKIHSDLLAHSEAVRKVSNEEHTPLIDLQADSIAYLDTLTEAQGQALGITKKDPQGNIIPDKTHLNYEGSYVFGRIGRRGHGQGRARSRAICEEGADTAACGRNTQRGGPSWRTGAHRAGGRLHRQQRRRMGSRLLCLDDSQCRVCESGQKRPQFKELL